MKPIAIVTGASSGIGAIYADRLARRGYDLVLVARREERLRDLAEDIAERHAVDVRSCAADLTSEADLARLEQFIRGERRLAMLVNNAGIGRLCRTADMTDDDTASTLSLNVIAPTRLCRAALPGLLARDSGAIINIASVMAIEVLPVTALYSASKSYLLMFSRGLQAEISGTGVRVQAVLPASTATDFWNGTGVALDDLDPGSVMTAEQLVDAALRGFDLGENVTFPTVEDEGLWESYETARRSLFQATQIGIPATRYRDSQ